MGNLILTICSNYKRSNSEAQKYDAGVRKITDDLSDDMGERISIARKLAFMHITREHREWKFLSTVPLNKKLKCGPDILPDNREDGAIYMPALKRYNGRFYREFQSAVGDIGTCIERLNGDAEDHLLIVSGLYGLLTPTELIQEYNCNVPEERVIRRLWKDYDLLTDLVIAYMRKYKINRVFDFMAEESYRHLINWEKIEEKTNSKIFYSYSSSPREGEQIGVNMLPRLGHAAGLLLRKKPELSLSNIRPGRTVGASGIKLRLDPPQWIPAGTYLSRHEIFAVWAIRMVTNIEIFLDKEDILRKRPYSVSSRIGEFCKQHNENEEIAKCMDYINNFRNEVIHEHGYIIETTNVQKIRECYKEVAKWAKEKKYAELEDIDY